MATRSLITEYVKNIDGNYTSVEIHPITDSESVYTTTTQRENENYGNYPGLPLEVGNDTTAQETVLQSLLKTRSRLYELRAFKNVTINTSAYNIKSDSSVPSSKILSHAVDDITTKIDNKYDALNSKFTTLDEKFQASSSSYISKSDLLFGTAYKNTNPPTTKNYVGIITGTDNTIGNNVEYSTIIGSRKSNINEGTFTSIIASNESIIQYPGFAHGALMWHSLIMGSSTANVRNDFSAIICGADCICESDYSAILCSDNSNIIANTDMDFDTNAIMFAHRSRISHSEYSGIFFGESNFIHDSKRSFILGDNCNISNRIGTYMFGSGLTASKSDGEEYDDVGRSNTQTRFYLGSYNNTNLGDDRSFDVLIIGSGTKTTRHNAFRLNSINGTWLGVGSYNTSGADYAEYFEWADGNNDNEKRTGYFVSLENDKIVKADEESDFILGVVSSSPSVVGNSDESWSKKYLKDEFGANIIETDKNGNAIGLKINPDFDSDAKYIRREDRKEWDKVGMLGVLVVRDDGTCEVNGFCKCGKNACATKSETGYRVISRVNDHLVKIIFR